MTFKPKLKSILIFVGVFVVAIIVYVVVFPSKSSKGPTLVPSSGLQPVSSTAGQTTGVAVPGDSVSREFLDLLLNIRGINLNADGVLTHPLFGSLLDFTITLVQDGSEGRSNPFAPIGSDFQSVTPPSEDSSEEEIIL